MICPLKSESDYEEALAEIERLWDAQPNTPEGDRLDILATLVEAYEAKHYPIPPPDPIEALRYYMESRGLTSADFTACVGEGLTAGEILNRQRPLTIDMIRRLHQNWGISADILIQPYSLAQAA